MKHAKWVQFLHSDSLVTLVVILAVLLLHGATDAISTLERRFYDFASTSTERVPSGQIAIVAIDDQSIANLGRWPWPRDIHARMIDVLANAHAKTIVHTAFFLEPQVDRGLTFIRQIKDVLTTSESADDPLRRERLTGLIAQAEQSLDTDGQLAASLGRAGNVIIPSLFTLGDPVGKPDAPLPAFALRSAVEDHSGFSMAALKSQQPLDILGHAAAGVGHLNQIQDVDGTMRQEPLLIHYDNKAVPSVALLAAVRALNLSVTDIRLHPGDSVRIGRRSIQTNTNAVMLPQFYPWQNGKPAFVVDSFYDVLNGKIPASKYTNKIVVIGATAVGVGTRFAVPGYAALSPAEAVAHVTSSILNGHFIERPAWSVYASLAVVLLVCAYLIGALPRLSAEIAALSTVLLFAALLGVEFGLLSGAALWLQLVFPATLLLLGHLAVTTRRFLVTEAGKHKSDEESAETNRMMGLALQGQGQLDMAFDRFGRVPMSAGLMDNLYNLALDFERKRQFNKAQAVYEHMAAFDDGYKDLKVKLNRAKNLSDTVILGGGGAHPGGTLLLDNGAVEKPMLGRYQIEKELGKGAMGVVYLGRDPKIGRVVAIKTLSLSSEFEGDELTDARERFFREAETAGRLQHPNIVTIFDAGEENDLAYIAMEFLKGHDLTPFCKDGHLLPIHTVVSIVARVADALSYAHGQHVVHRDIKPANIMYAPDTDTVKVTDFGIARITDSSKTKTGLVLGTPSFMSPEQMIGKKVDGRSDLYSLGVMLFQMLTGVLPFRGDSMAELMYKIANENAPDIHVVRPDLPDGLVRVVTRALSKNPDVRYQDGAQLAQALRTAVDLSDHGTAKAAAVRVQPPSTPGDATDATHAQTPPAFEATVPASFADFAHTVVDAQLDVDTAHTPNFEATMPASLSDFERTARLQR